MSERKIRVDFMYPPIPVRSFDYYAYYEDEAGEGRGGCGATEAEAIADLKGQDDE